jgi:dienelactone hydrolase
MKYEYEFHKKFKGAIIIDYGIIKGNNKVFFIKAGQDGSMYGYKNKYVKMAENINKKYGCTVIVASNPFDGNNPLDNAMDVIDEVMKDSNYEIYYFGYSNGALIGAWFGTKYDKIKRMVLVNGPLMYNYHKTKQGALDFKGDRITFVYGEYDQSIQYTNLLSSIVDDKIKLEIIKDEDHHFSNKDEDFQTIPEKYLFYDFEVGELL